ncbi:Hypothetical predicted protein, partial [Olea europaea subsp. europaea]
VLTGTALGEELVSLQIWGFLIPKPTTLSTHLTYISRSPPHGLSYHPRISSQFQSGIK